MGSMLLERGGLAGFAGLEGYGKNCTGKGGLAGFAGLDRVMGENFTGKGMSSPALPAARALSLAAGPLQDK